MKSWQFAPSVAIEQQQQALTPRGGPWRQALEDDEAIKDVLKSGLGDLFHQHLGIKARDLNRFFRKEARELRRRCFGTNKALTRHLLSC